jgi:tetratricopeptide (TPR) repeat protein/TolB-like protein
MMQIFLRILTSKVTPISAVAACIFAIWKIAEASESTGLGYALAVVAIVGFVGHFWAKTRTTIPDKDSLPNKCSKKRIRLAVLPLEPNPKSNHVTSMGDQISRQVIRSLAQINDLEVIEEHSIFHLPRDKGSFDEIAQYLDGFDYLVKGSLRRDGMDCSVTAQISCRDGRILSTIEKRVPWNLLDHVPASIFERILNSLNIKTKTPRGDDKWSAQMMVLELPTDVTQAWEAYGNGKLNMKYYNIYRKKDHFVAAEQSYRKAITLDPTYADAYVELGFLKLIAWETESKEALLKESGRYFREALKHDPSHPKALCELGYISFLEGKVVEALTKAQDAIDETNPRAVPYNVLSLLYLYLGFWEESIRLTEIVNVLDPLYTYPYTNAALSCQLIGLHDESVKWTERSAEKGPGGFTSALLKGAAYFRAKHLDRALECWQEGRHSANDHEKFLFDIVTAWIPASEGKTNEVREIIKDKAFDVWAHGAYAQFAISLLALAGEHERCLLLLEQEKTYASSYRYLTADQTLSSLYRIPQFQVHLQKRYSAWLEHVHLWGNRLKRPPAVVQPPENLR